MNNYEIIKNMSLDCLENCLCQHTDCIYCQATYGEDINVDLENHVCHNSKDSIIGIWLRSEVK